MRLTFAFAAAVFAVALPAAAQAPSGETVYRQHCAGCHNGTMPRMPSRDALKTLTPEHVETALSSFTMRRAGAALSLAERRAVAEYVTGRTAGSYRAPLDVIPKSAYCRATNVSDPLAPPVWNGFGGNLQNTRFQSAAAAGISPTAVPRLKLKWAFGLPGVSASGSQVTVAGRRAYVGSRNGVVYALDAKSGCIAWAFEADAGVRSTPVVGRTGGTTALYFGDANAQVYALDLVTGKLRWKVKVEIHQDAMVTGAVAVANGKVYVPVASIEEGTAIIPTYECCTFRGSIVALDAVTGQAVWKTFTIADPPQPTTKTAAGTQLWGPSGGGVWSTPVLEPDRNRMYIAVGDNYSNPATPTSDAIMALAMDTGKILWTTQATVGDAWNTACLEEPNGAGRAHCPSAPGPDHDFASAPVLATGGGRRVLLAGQKSGMLYGMNPDTGAYLWKTQVGDGGVLGGIEWGFAVDNARAYVSLSNALEKKPGEAGGIAAVDIADGTIKWRTPPSGDTCGGRTGCSTGQPAAVSAIPGMVFSASLDGHLRGYEAETGQVIFDTDTARDFPTVNGVKARGGSMNGPGSTVVDGVLYVSSGYGSLGFMPGNVLLAFSVDGK
jgi:polyvinyl alcohol dehydrogenase (cytochrome)